MRPSLFESALVALALAGCSLGTVSRDDCDPQACQANFGFGYVCATDGFCEQIEPTNRCTKTYPEDLFTRPLDYSQTIVIGNLMDETLGTHVARERAAQIAAESANAVGEGRTVFGIVFCTIEENTMLDGSTRTEAAVASARFLAERLHLPAIVGPAASGDTQEVFLALREAGLDTLVISPSATSTALTGIDVTDPTDENPGLLWRTAPPDTVQSVTIVQDMELRGITDVYVIHTTDAYGQSLADAFAELFSGTETLVPLTSSTTIAETAFDASTSSAQEVLFISSQTTDTAQFVTATIGLSGFDTKTIFLTDSAANSDFLAGTTSATSRYPQISGTRPALTGPVYLLFQSAYRGAFTDDPAQFTFTANAYDAAFLVFYGIEWAIAQEGGIISGTNIARGLRHVSGGEPIELRASTFATAINAFERGESVDVIGASGSLDYDAQEETAGAIEIWTPADLMTP